jgi:hypothetical protein
VSGVAPVALWCAGTIHAAGVAGQGTWETTLQARDLDGDGETDAYYDTVLNVTWLRNANVNGIQFWDEAKAWAKSLRHGGYRDWRLPMMVDTGALGCDWAYGGTDCGYNVQTLRGRRTFSEMEHLIRVTLGNVAYCGRSGVCEQPGWGLGNTGNFQNLMPYFYWTGASYYSPPFAWYYYTPTVYQSFAVKLLGMHAMAVRTGDSVPRVAGSLKSSVDKTFPGMASVPGRGTWQTTLQPRDLDGDGVADAFYDTVLNVTWLRDLGAGGLQFWDDGNAWVKGLRIGGYSDWRLPTMKDTGSAGCNPGFAGTDCGFNVKTLDSNQTLSELGHLMLETLGNKGYCDPDGICDLPGWRVLNTGDFQNMQSIFIWTDLDYAPDPRLAWYYYPYIGYQSFGFKHHLLQMLPVRSGDSGVPLPRAAATGSR